MLPTAIAGSSPATAGSNPAAAGSPVSVDALTADVSSHQPIAALHVDSESGIDYDNDNDMGIWDTCGRQISKSIRRTVAKMVKRQEKLANPNVNMKKVLAIRRVKSQLSALTTIAMETMRNEEISEIGLLEQQVSDCHRQRSTTIPLNIMGAVVKVLTRKDNEWYSQAAKDALLKESAKLMQAGVWDLEPMSKSAALAEHSDAAFSRLFEILGIKNSELASDAIYKARIVVQGSNVKDGWGESVYFSDTSSAPTNMCAIRSVVAFGELTGGSSAADAEAAYIQPELDDSIHLYVSIPDSLLAPEMKAKQHGISQPVYRHEAPIVWLVQVRRHLGETSVRLFKDHRAKL